MLRLALITDKENQTYVEFLEIAVEIEICWSIQKDLTMGFTYKLQRVNIFVVLFDPTLKICLSMQYMINIEHKIKKINII